MHTDDSHKDDSSSQSQANSVSSYVYPVRSLLAGIQAAAPVGLSDHDDGSQGYTSPTHLRSNRLATSHRSRSSGNISALSDFASPSMSPQRSVDPDPASVPSERHHHHREHHKQRRSKHSVPNFRDFTPDESPFSPRTFSTALPHSRGPAEAVPSAPSIDGKALYSGSQSEEDNVAYGYNARHPAQLSDVAAEAFADKTSSSMLVPKAAAEEQARLQSASSTTQDHAPACGSPPSNFSQSGIVHLGPIDENSGSRSSSGGRSSGRRTSPFNTGPNSHSNSGNGSLSHSRPPAACVSSGSGSGSASPGLSADRFNYSSDPSSSSLVSGSASVVSGSSGSSGPHMTLRYQHMEDENGHHLIVGREGVLTKCEDEPIRTPGAVQGYGVLIAVAEDLDTGNLVVRQVSENSTELLGLSPSYLFGLECFTQTLPEHQADVLFDNIEYLSDTALTAEEQAENLHVFMVSGWGEPQSALPSETHGDSQNRRMWSCWCAAHRPRMTAPANLASGETGLDSAYQNIIILEFELEHDTFNPLYPPSRTSATNSARSGVSSPSDASVSASNSSGRTLVSSSEESVGVTTPEGSSSSVAIASDNPASSGIPSPPAFSPVPSSLTPATNLPGDEDWMPTPEEILESTTSRSKPLLALERLRRTRQDESAPQSEPRGDTGRARGSFRRRRGAGVVGMMDVFAVMAQINEQLGAAPDLETFVQVTAGLVKDLTQFHRVLVYQFDEAWNGQVVAELVDWNQSHDLFRGLHFPATDIPAQARELYALNKVRLLYDRGQPTARLVVRSKADLEKPLDMTHCYLRAMSPIHIKYLGNMGVRASMSVSIIAFGTLWGLVACHSYGPHGMRVSFPVRQMLRLLSQSISRNIERLSYAQRLHTRKLINTMPTDQHPGGYIVSNADDLLSLFDADYGVLVIGEGAKILGPNQHGQEILIIAEYLRLKQFRTLQVSQAVTVDYPDLQLTNGLEIIAGLLYVPLSTGGRDFIAFLRKGQPREVHWAGRPYKTEGQRNVLEPRRSFKIWSETVAGRCRAWTDEHIETAGVLALVYGKFIEVWRQKESALQTTKLTNILLSNASHEVRTPLNHIINYLELAMNGPLDTETRENLSHSHAASKSLLFTINDLLDLTRLETGNETSFNEPFDLHQAIEDATQLYRNEARRRGLQFILDLQKCPRQVVGDSRKIRTVVSNLTANALKYTMRGAISVTCRAFDEPTGLRDSGDIAVEIVVADTGTGIPSDKLENIFREFEQVETAPRAHSPGLGLGLAVVARIVEQVGGQLRVDSVLGEGSRFSFLLPLTTDLPGTGNSFSSGSSVASRGSEIQDLVQAFSSNHLDDPDPHPDGQVVRRTQSRPPPVTAGQVEIRGSATSLKPVKVNEFDLDTSITATKVTTQHRSSPAKRSPSSRSQSQPPYPRLRILIVEDNDINRMILAKRLSLDGHTVVNTTNGQEGIEVVQADRHFDCILMDIQMPLINGYEATERIRALEKDVEAVDRVSHRYNGRIPIFAVSASLFEHQREELHRIGMDGWILKPIDFKRLRMILRGVVDPSQREQDVYRPGNWEVGGWLSKPQIKTH